MAQVVRHEGLDEVIAVIVSGMATQSQSLTRFGRGGLEALR